MSLNFNGNADLDSVVYNGNEVEVVMCDGAEVWRRIKSVNVPKLSGTSFKTKGTATGPTVSGFDSSIMTQEGTVLTNALGTHIVTWKLKDTSKYCWSDGTTGAKSEKWTLTADTITFYVRAQWEHRGSSQFDTYQQSTYKVTYGTSWLDICKQFLAPSERKVLGAYGEWDTFKSDFGYYTHSGGTTYYIYCGYMTRTIPKTLYGKAESEDFTGVWPGPNGLSEQLTDINSCPQNGKTYYMTSLTT